MILIACLMAGGLGLEEQGGEGTDKAFEN
jgi:hypothetical protein